MGQASFTHTGYHTIHEVDVLAENIEECCSRASWDGASYGKPAPAVGALALIAASQTP
jgi:hypothetical protein